MKSGRAAPRRIRLAAAAAAGAVFLTLFHRAAGRLLLQTALAVLLAWAAHPLCRRLERRLPPGTAALLSLLAFLLAAGGLVWLFIPQLVTQLSLAVEAIPLLTDLLQGVLDRLEATALFARLHITLTSSEELVQRAAAALLSAVPAAVQRIAALGERLMRAVLAPVLAFYFLRDRDAFTFQLSLLVPCGGAGGCWRCSRKCAGRSPPTSAGSCWSACRWRRLPPWRC